MSLEGAADKAIEKVESIKRNVGLPEKIRDIGGKREQLGAFADKSIQIRRLMDINPVQPSRDDLMYILESAF